MTVLILPWLSQRMPGVWDPTTKLLFFFCLFLPTGKTVWCLFWWSCTWRSLRYWQYRQNHQQKRRQGDRYWCHSPNVNPGKGWSNLGWGRWYNVGRGGMQRIFHLKMTFLMLSFQSLVICSLHRQKLLAGNAAGYRTGWPYSVCTLAARACQRKDVWGDGKTYHSTNHPSPLSSFSSHNNRPPPSPMQWGNPEVVKKRLGSNVIDIHFERGVIKKPVLSPDHYWETSNAKGGALIQAIQTIKDPRRSNHFEMTSCKR